MDYYEVLHMHAHWLVPPKHLFGIVAIRGEMVAENQLQQFCVYLRFKLREITASLLNKIPTDASPLANVFSS